MRDRERKEAVIETKYCPAVGARGARIIARDRNEHRASISYPHEVRGGPEAVHFQAAKALAEKLGWSGELAGGQTREGWVWVWIDSRTAANVYNVGEQLGLCRNCGERDAMSREGFCPGCQAAIDDKREGRGSLVRAGRSTPRKQNALFRSISSGMARAAFKGREDEYRKALTVCLAELREIHSGIDKRCFDQGPTTCPTWEAIHAAQDALGVPCETCATKAGADA